MKTLTPEEKLAVIDARLMTIEEVLTSLVPGFYTDLREFATNEIAKDEELSTDSKTKIYKAIDNIQLKHKNALKDKDK